MFNFSSNTSIMENKIKQDMNNHWYNEGKEILNQGRSKKQMKNNYKITGFSLICIIVTLILIAIFG